MRPFFRQPIFVSWILCCCAIVVFDGCSKRNDSKVHVFGSVEIDGEPLEEGSIAFRPSRGTSGNAARSSIANGQYDIPVNLGPSKGQYRIIVRTGNSSPVSRTKNGQYDIPKDLTPRSIYETEEQITSDQGKCQINLSLDSKHAVRE